MSAPGGPIGRSRDFSCDEGLGRQPTLDSRRARNRCDSGPFGWWRGQDLNLRPSGYESDDPCFMGFTSCQKSRDSGLLSTTDPDYDCLHGSQGRTSVILVVILSTLKPPQKHPTKTPHKKAHRRNRVIYTESDDISVAPTRCTRRGSSPSTQVSMWAPFGHWWPSHG